MYISIYEGLYDGDGGVSKCAKPQDGDWHIGEVLEDNIEGSIKWVEKRRIYSKEDIFKYANEILEKIRVFDKDIQKEIEEKNFYIINYSSLDVYVDSKDCVYVFELEIYNGVNEYEAIDLLKEWFPNIEDVIE